MDGWASTNVKLLVSQPGASNVIENQADERPQADSSTACSRAFRQQQSVLSFAIGPAMHLVGFANVATGIAFVIPRRTG